MTEAEFSKVVQKMLGSISLHVTRLESHDTSVGIPDMFVQGHGTDLFIELKSMPKVSAAYPNTETIAIDWRPGQQAWALEYYKRHLDHKCSLTMVKFKDAIGIIPMYRVFENRKVPWSDIYVCERFKWYDLKWLLQVRSLSAMTYREYINDLVDVLKSGYFDYDPDVLFNDAFDEYADNYLYKNDVDIDSPVSPILIPMLREYVTDYVNDNS